jgi:hypothetical protein
MEEQGVRVLDGPERVAVGYAEEGAAGRVELIRGDEGGEVIE